MSHENKDKAGNSMQSSGIRMHRIEEAALPENWATMSKKKQDRWLLDFATRANEADRGWR